MKWKKRKKEIIESPERKTVEYKGEKFLITARSYGFTHQVMSVNNEQSSITMWSKNLQNPEQWKFYAVKAIEEYMARKKAEEEFRYWDGKL